MKSIRRFSLGGLVLAASLYFVHAQQTATVSMPDEPVSETSEAMSVMLQALEQTTPLSPSLLPEDIHGFYSVQHPEWPPLPGDMFGLNVWPLGNGLFALDDRNVDYVALQAASAAAAALKAAATPKIKMSLLASSLASSYAYSNPVYLTNLTANIAYDGSTTTSFAIGGGTNFVPYDIVMATNLTLPPENWTWLGIGYTTNNYTFSEQPADYAFYRLAKPSKTMTVGWGNNSSNQCNVPTGLTNVLMVAGGFDFSLGLLNNGNIVGWGDSDPAFAIPTSLTNNVMMIAAGWNHNVALLTNGSVVAWGHNVFGELNVPAHLTNATVISAQSLNTLALRSDGTVAAWGDNGYGQTNVPAGLNNVMVCPS
jgi:hypothetical protein